jgi:AcrR family transcriptional regulator
MERRATTTSADPDKREAILDAALELFGERGFHGTAVPQVAERAGVGAGTIYRYFESKEALVNAVYQRWKTAMGRALMEEFPIQAPVREQFHVFWRRMADFSRRHRKAMMFLELHHHGTYIDDKSRACEETVLAAGRMFFDETRRRQVTKEIDSDLAIALVWGAFSALVKGCWQRDLELTDELLDAAENCMWEAIRR